MTRSKLYGYWHADVAGFEGSEAAEPQCRCGLNQSGVRWRRLHQSKGSPWIVPYPACWLGETSEVSRLEPCKPLRRRPAEPVEAAAERPTQCRVLPGRWPNSSLNSSADTASESRTYGDFHFQWKRGVPARPKREPIPPPELLKLVPKKMLSWRKKSFTSQRYRKL